MPVIAAPTPRPVMPASELGESTTRSAPNSSTSPDSTVNGVPASATSSPSTNTVGSRRSSSASASLIAWANVNVRVPVATTLGEDILVHLARVGVRGGERKGEAALDLGARLVLDPPEVVGRRDLLRLEPHAVQRDRIAVVAPEPLLVLRAVVRPVDVADVVAVVAIRVREQERRPAARACTRDQLRRLAVHGANVLPVHLAALDPERARSREQLACGRLEVVRVLVVEVVLADVDHGQRPERGHVHDLVHESLAERALAEEADRDLIRAAALRRERGPGGDAGRAADDRVRAEVAVLVVGDVHRAALAAAVARLLAEQLGEHPARLGALREAVTVPAVRRRDPVVPAERGAHADRDPLLADVQVRQARHLRAPVQLVRLLLEEPDQRHPGVHLARELRVEHGGRRDRVHTVAPARMSVSRPAIEASTSKRTAKSRVPMPMPFAAERSWFVTAVVGSGTSSCRPSSRARFMSFCIMRQSNHTSSGWPSTSGPRYVTIGDAITDASITSTAFSRGMPLFSASSRPSLKASICTASERLIAILIVTAAPLGPTYTPRGPIASSTGLARSNASSEPPTMSDALPWSTVIDVPEIGESSSSAPVAATCSASARV